VCVGVLRAESVDDGALCVCVCVCVCLLAMFLEAHP
jgi:hypothetical protein